MLRQRVRAESSTLAGLAVRGLAALIGVALAYYGAMLLLLAVKVEPETINDLSGYRSVYDYLAGLEANDFGSSERLLIGLIALAVGLVAAFLAWRGLPRPHLARGPVTLQESEVGITEVQPRAMERAVECAAIGHAEVDRARARYEDGRLVLSVSARNAARLVETLREIEGLAHASLDRHQLSVDRVDLILASYNSPNRRELA